MKSSVNSIFLKVIKTSSYFIFFVGNYSPIGNIVAILIKHEMKREKSLKKVKIFGIFAKNWCLAVAL